MCDQYTIIIPIPQRSLNSKSSVQWADISPNAGMRKLAVNNQERKEAERYLSSLKASWSGERANVP